MKVFKKNLNQPKVAGLGSISHRKASIGTSSGKENTNLANYQVKILEKKHQNKESSPKTSGCRAIQCRLSSTLLTGRALTKQDRLTHQKTSGSQDRISTQEQKERSCTPGSIKEFMSKVRMQSFHLSPKENFKVNFKGKNLRMGSPKNQEAKKFFTNAVKYDRKTLGSSSPKSRQITSEFFSSENLITTQTEGGFGTKSMIKGSILSQGAYPTDLYAQESLIVPETINFTLTCINHPLKKSKFYLTDLEKFGDGEGGNTCYKGVCSKCAVKLASDGHNIEEILLGDEEIKKKRFSQLIQRITTVMSLVKLTKEHLSTREEKAFSFYKVQLESLKEAQTHIDKLFTSFIRNSELIKKTLSEEHQRHVMQCTEFKTQLSRKEIELQHLAKHISECQTNTDLLTEVSNLDKYIGSFNEALSTTVEDCKALHEIKLTCSKLSPSLLVLASQIESKLQDLLKLRQTDLLFQHPTIEKYTHQLSVWAEMSKQMKQSLISESSVDTTSWNEYNGNRQRLLSFDMKGHNESINQCKNHLEVSMDKDSPSKNFNSILERIDESQAEKNKFYAAVLSQETDQLFQIAADPKAFNEQQTPELGIKEHAPAFLKEQLSILQSNYEAFSLQKKSASKQNFKQEVLSGWSQDRVYKSESSQMTNFTEAKETIYHPVPLSLAQGDGQHSQVKK
jgi:hypothetical protein